MGKFSNSCIHLMGYILWGYFVRFSIFYGEKKRASPVAQTVKDLPARQETQVQSLGWEDSQSHWSGYLLHYSCIEYSMNRGACWAIVHGVTKSKTWLLYIINQWVVRHELMVCEDISSILWNYSKHVHSRWYWKKGLKINQKI